ncbi:MAG: peptidase C13 [Rhodanobacter sp.]
MSTLLALALLLGAPQGTPDDSFATRVTQGKLAEAGNTGPAYQKQLWDQVTDPFAAALKACIVSNAPADKSPFTVVADVSPDGKPQRIDVQPATPVANCFALSLDKMTLPAPPKLPDSTTYPIEIDVSIVP